MSIFRLSVVTIFRPTPSERSSTFVCGARRTGEPQSLHSVFTSLIMYVRIASCDALSACPSPSVLQFVCPRCRCGHRRCRSCTDCIRQILTLLPPQRIVWLQRLIRQTRVTIVKTHHSGLHNGGGGLGGSDVGLDVNAFVYPTGSIVSELKRSQ
jgi:hypothetical protein